MNSLSNYSDIPRSYFKKERPMGNDSHLLGDTLEIDSFELLIRFIITCKNQAEKNESKAYLMKFADIVSAVYYYRKYPNIEDFLRKYMSNGADYFHIRWAREIWSEFSKMSQAQISELVIKKISLVAKSEQEQ